jgi:hypothetical protein
VFDESYIHTNPVFSSLQGGCSRWDSARHLYTASTQAGDLLRIRFWACDKLALDATLCVFDALPEAEPIQARIQELAELVLGSEDRQRLMAAVEQYMREEAHPGTQRTHHIEAADAFYDDFFAEYTVLSHQLVVRIFYLKT